MFIPSPSWFPPVHYSLLKLFCAARCLYFPLPHSINSLLTSHLVLCCQLVILSPSSFPAVHYPLLNLFCVASCLYLLLPHSLQFITHFLTWSVLPACYTFSFLNPSNSLISTQFVLCWQLFIHSPSSFPPVHYSLINLFCAASCF